jgi:hypothetical protein
VNERASEGLAWQYGEKYLEAGLIFLFLGQE